MKQDRGYDHERMAIDAARAAFTWQSPLATDGAPRAGTVRRELAHISVVGRGVATNLPSLVPPCGGQTWRGSRTRSHVAMPKAVNPGPQKNLCACVRLGARAAPHERQRASGGTSSATAEGAKRVARQHDAGFTHLRHWPRKVREDRTWRPRRLCRQRRPSATRTSPDAGARRAHRRLGSRQSRRRGRRLCRSLSPAWRGCQSSRRACSPSC